MPLTPADVHNVAFSKPPIGKRGYNEDEVDAFLDLVENELTRLIEENADLRQRVAELDQELATARSGGGSAQPTTAIPLYDRFATTLRSFGLPTATGRFGAEMQVELVNDGPVTLIVDTAEPPPASKPRP